MKVQSKFFLMSTAAIFAIISSASAVDVPGMSRAIFLKKTILRKDTKLSKTDDQIMIEDAFDERGDGYTRRKTVKADKTESQLRVLCRELKDVIESNENGDLDNFALKDECGNIQPYADRAPKAEDKKVVEEEKLPAANPDDEMTVWRDSDGIGYQMTVGEARELEEKANKDRDIEIQNQKGTGNQGTGNQGKGTGNQGTGNQGKGDQRNNPGPVKDPNDGNNRNNPGPVKPNDGNNRNNPGPVKPNDGNNRNNPGPVKPNDGDQRNNPGPVKKPGTGNQGKGTGNQGKGNQRNNSGPVKPGTGNQGNGLPRLERVQVELIKIERPITAPTTIDVSKLPSMPTLKLKPSVLNQEMIHITFAVSDKDKKKTTLKMSNDDRSFTSKDKKRRKHKANSSTEIDTDNADLIASLNTLKDADMATVEDVNNLREKNYEPIIRKAALIRAAAGLSSSAAF